MSAYPMTDVGSAIAQVLKVCSSLPPRPTEFVAVGPEALGRFLAEDIVATEAFPPWEAAVLDGFAVCAPLAANTTLEVSAFKCTAGSDPPEGLVGPGRCVYVTTGAKLPEGANAVVGVEKTAPASEEAILVSTDVPLGANTRPPGKDLKAGTLILPRSQLLGPQELGIMATVGRSYVPVLKKVVVGVISCGDELVPISEPSPRSGCIRDTNKTMLVSILQKFGAEVVDFGITKDNRDTLRGVFLRALDKCDVIISSGGVSMGTSDHVKPLLEELGSVAFGRLNMKPGKPTTFAKIGVPETSPPRVVVAFALPGNPVSCFVTSLLLVSPALKRMVGVAEEACYHPQVSAATQTPIKMDPERPEYHRVSLEWSDQQGLFSAQSTGPQQSSRVMSLIGANALMCVPKGSEVLPVGTVLPVLVISELPPPPAGHSFHVSREPSAPLLRRPEIPAGASAAAFQAGVNPCACILSVQLETGAAAKGRNLAGSIVAKHLLLNNVTVLEMSLAVNPSVDDIRETVTRWCALLGSKGFILVVGGCGLGEHAVVPDALASMATKAAPMLGLMILRQAALESDCPESMATERTFAGSCSEGTFVSTLPCDSSGGTFPILNASIGVLLPLLPRILGVSERKL